jgi:hypothetical protein
MLQIGAPFLEIQIIPQKYQLTAAINTNKTQTGCRTFVG